MIDILKEIVDIRCEGHDSGVDREIMPSIVYVIGHDLKAEVGHGVESFLRQEDGADAFGAFEVAKLEGDELLGSIEVSVNSSVVPSWRDHQLDPNVDVVVSAGELEQLVVELVEVFAAVLRVEQELAVGQFAGVGENSDVFKGPAEDEETHANVIR